MAPPDGVMRASNGSIPNRPNQSRIELWFIEARVLRASYSDYNPVNNNFVNCGLAQPYPNPLPEDFVEEDIEIRTKADPLQIIPCSGNQHLGAVLELRGHNLFGHDSE